MPIDRINNKWYVIVTEIRKYLDILPREGGITMLFSRLKKGDKFVFKGRVAKEKKGPFIRIDDVSVHGWNEAPFLGMMRKQNAVSISDGTFWHVADKTNVNKIEVEIKRKPIG